MIGQKERKMIILVIFFIISFRLLTFFVKTSDSHSYDTEGFFHDNEEKNASLILQKANLRKKGKGENKCTIPTLHFYSTFYDYGKKPLAKCENLVEVGGRNTSTGLVDGSKFVCFDKYLQIEPNNCIVLSFGINDEWSFDDAMDAFGCEVYAFDPTMDRSNFNRTERIHFFNLGLSDSKGWITIKDKPRPVDSYQNILARIGLTNKKIDYLKMDIEGSEIAFFEEVFKTSSHLLRKVNQISMEIHPMIPEFENSTKGRKLKSKLRFQKLWKGMHQLECNGFQLAHFEKNRVERNHYTIGNRTESLCYELLWIRRPVQN